MAENKKQPKGSIVYFSHGGGPLPVLGDPGHTKLVSFLKKLPSEITKPDEILVISAHWEESMPRITGNKSPSLFYDYYGFPEESYNLAYPVRGNPDLAAGIQTLLEEKGIKSEISMERGLDHGVFIPLLLMYPEADIPVTQLSLIKGLDPADHIRLGEALRPLIEKNILIIGSGFSFHNMREFAFDGREKADSVNDGFQNWLIDACCGPKIREAREESLIEWTGAPGARYCHPREEHLMPLHVCYGIAGDKGDLIFDDYILGKRAVAFRW